ncbi:hypothetical protein GWK47_016336 [Chionoecetes opilio]|uniref:RING-type domain-containing protein n=1 Tax=Chionoecetes opilio TaxID=41210 RepID=A0A8J4XRY7_CHIOP|nr:hypothetical protein GWK47_016336 [Chionoecetes opilio]
MLVAVLTLEGTTCYQSTGNAVEPRACNGGAPQEGAQVRIARARPSIRLPPDGAPEGEVPPVSCPVCLEAWNTSDRLPKFLSCHHSVCVTCAGRLQRPVPPAPSAPSRRTSPSTPTSPLARLIANRVSTVSVSEPTKGEETFQEELVERANEAKRWAQGRAGEYRRQVEVYRWLCGLLRHAHGRVLDSLTHAQHTHRRLHHHSQDLQALVKRGEALQKSQEQEEQVVEQLVRAVEEVEERQRAVAGEADFVELLQKFPVMSTHKGPRGYNQARVVLEANESVMLSFCGEEEIHNDACSRRGSGAKDTGRSSRSNSLTDGSRRKATSRQMVRTRSLLHTKGKSEHLLDPGDASDHLPSPSRTSTPTSRRSAMGVFDNTDVYEEEASLSLNTQTASTPQPPRSKKYLNKEFDLSPSDVPSASCQDTDACRQALEDEYNEPSRPRGRRGRGSRRRRADRENRPSGHRRAIQKICVLM